MRVFLRIKELPDMCQPAHLRRRDDLTLVTVDPRNTRLIITTWCVDTLTHQEREAYLQAFGVPADTPAEDWMTDDGPCLLYVPPSLRLTDDPPLQGGTELLRRFREGTMQDEIALYMNETAQSARGA